MREYCIYLANLVSDGKVALLAGVSSEAGELFLLGDFEANQLPRTVRAVSVVKSFLP